MKQDNINYFAVGSFVLAMLLLLMFSLYRITGKGAGADAYYVQYADVSGIQEGSSVTYGGFEIGKVLNIEPVRDKGVTRYRLTLGVRSAWPIPADSTAQIVAPGLLADKQIDIQEGQSAQNLSPGDEIKGLAAMDIMAMMNQLSGEFQELSDGDIRPLISKLSHYLTAIGEDLNQSIPKITADTSTLLSNLNNSAAQLNQLLNGDNQQHLQQLFKNANSMSESLLKLTENLNTTSNQIDQLLTASNRLLDDNSNDIRLAVVDLRATLDVLARNMNIIVHNLDSSSRNMNEFTRELRRNPAALINSKPPQDNAQE